MSSEEKSYPSDKADKVLVRMPDGMRDRLKAAAKMNKRTMNAEIIARLEESWSPRLDAAWILEAPVDDESKTAALDQQTLVNTNAQKLLDARNETVRLTMLVESASKALQAMATAGAPPEAVQREADELHKQRAALDKATKHMEKCVDTLHNSRLFMLAIENEIEDAREEES